jgi:hypothetical protein
MTYGSDSLLLDIPGQISWKTNVFERGAISIKPLEQFELSGLNHCRVGGTFTQDELEVFQFCKSSQEWRYEPI